MATPFDYIQLRKFAETGMEYNLLKTGYRRHNKKILNYVKISNIPLGFSYTTMWQYSATKKIKFPAIIEKKIAEVVLRRARPPKSNRGVAGKRSRLYLGEIYFLALLVAV